MPVIGYSTHIVAACDLPEDTVYKMTKAMAENVDAMAAVVKPITGLTPKDMAVDIGVPLHKGAAKFYKEDGRDLSGAIGRRALGSAARMVVSGRERRATAPPARALRRGRRASIAVAMSLYHMYVAAFGPPEARDLPRHAPAVRADAGLPALPAAPGRRRARGASLDIGAARCSAGRACCTSSSTTSTSSTASSTSTT